MSTRIDQTIDTSTVQPDNLIAGLAPSPEVYTVTIAKGAEEVTYKRGTALAKGEDGKMYILGTAGTAGTFTATGDGSTVKFSLINDGVIPAAVTEVKVDGTALTSGFSYIAANGDLIFDEAPANTKSIAVKTVIGTFTANAVLADDVTVGTSTDGRAVAYRTGHFNENALIVKDSYTITADDKEAFRIAGILLSDAIK